MARSFRGSVPHAVPNRLKSLALACSVAMGGLAAHGAALADTSVVYSFAGGSGGSQPSSGVVQTPDGYFYGTTFYGTADANGNSWGAIYRVKKDGSAYQVMYTFTGRADGGSPMSDLLLGADGALYGATTSGYGGGAQYGTIWRLTTAGAFTTLHTFNNADGSYPAVKLAQDSTGVLYGGGAGGGGGGRGVIFSMKTDGSLFTIIHQFSGDANGGAPRGVTLGSDGVLYGVTASGGTTGDGVVFALDRDGNDFRVVHSFNVSAGEGGNPQAALVQNSTDGYFYSTTNGGGTADGYGTVFKVNAAGSFSTVLALDSILDGAYPTSPVTFGANGDVYGTTTGGGPSGFNGTFFEVSTAGKLTGVVSLPDGVNQVQAGLTIGADGLLYTTASAGGASGNGAILSSSQIFPAPVNPVPTETIFFDTLTRPPITEPVTTVGKKIKLHWVSQYASYCTASGSWSGTLKPTGDKLVEQAVAGTYPYTLTCHNPAGSSSTTSMLQVNPK